MQRMVKMRAIAAVVLAAGLSACATATPYQPRPAASRAVTGGFAEQRIEADRWRVSFAGNSLTGRDTVETYLLYRAAELTLQEGGDWFAVVDRKTDRKSRTYLETDPFYGSGFGYWRPAWRYYGRGYGWRGWDPYWGDPFWSDRAEVRTIERFEASAEILVRRGAKPLGDPAAFDARGVVENLGPRVQRPQS